MNMLDKLKELLMGGGAVPGGAPAAGGGFPSRMMNPSSPVPITPEGGMPRMGPRMQRGQQGMMEFFGGMPPQLKEILAKSLGLLPGGAPGGPMGMSARRITEPADPGAGAPNVSNVAKTVMPQGAGQNPWLEQLLKSLPRPPMPAQPPAGAAPGFPYQPNPIGQWGARQDI